MAKAGDPITKKLSKGRLFFKRSGETNFLDLGNVVKHKYSPEIGRLDHEASGDGLNQVDFNLVNKVKLKYEFELDEVTVELLRLAMLGTVGADAVQSAGNVAAETLCTTSSKQGRTYFAAAQGLTAVVVKVGASVKVEGSDYTVDPVTGAITFVEGGTIADNSTVTVDYTKPLVTRQPITLLKELRAAGTFKFFEKDQFATTPRAIHDYDGQIQVIDWGENDGNFNIIKVETLCSGKPVVSVRKD